VRLMLIAYDLPKCLHSAAMIYLIMEILDSSYETHYDKYEMAKYTRVSKHPSPKFTQFQKFSD
jgi:hypothetical protein